MLFPRAVMAALAPVAAAAAAASHARMHAVAQQDIHDRAVEMWRTSDTICGFTNPHQGSRALNTVQKIQSAEDADDNLIKVQKTEPITVMVNLHAALPANVSDSYVSEEQLQKQFRVLQEEYEPLGIEMKLGNITRNLDNSLTKLSMTFDDEGALNGSTPEIEAFWKKRRTGDYRTLNIFVYEQMTGALGACNFPDEDRTEETFYLDACHIVSDTLPDSGTMGVWNAGGGAVHEVGHWFGLFHVWGDSCEDEGDLVADTPAQRSPSMSTPSSPSCEGVRDSCPDQAGHDSVHNFMDYSGDDCASEFTAGQKARMHTMFETIRAKK